MVNQLHQATEWLNSQLEQNCSESVVYKRGADSVVLPACIGQSDHESVDDYGVVITHESRDFIITASKLILNGVTVLPERGDLIIETQNSKQYEHKVLPFGARKNHFRYSDPHRVAIRIFTKLVDTDDV